MTVTKQQQLEFAAMHIEKWKSGYDFAVIEKTNDGQLCVRWPSICSVGVSKKEWQQEREKMQKQQDNSLSKRGSCPPIGEQVELWLGGSFAYNCEFICMRDNNYIVWNLDADRPDCSDFMNTVFRPIRTEREKAIDALIEIICAGGELSKDGSAAREIAERIYEAQQTKEQTK